MLVLAGKDCCKEFIIGFSAGIMLTEVDEEIAKGGGMDDAMIGKLSIEFTRISTMPSQKKWRTNLQATGITPTPIKGNRKKIKEHREKLESLSYNRLRSKYCTSFTSI